MTHIARWKVMLIVVISLLSFAYCVPSFLPEEKQVWLEQNTPAWFPNKSASLGLDLKGGSHLLLEVDVADVIRQHADDSVQGARKALRDENIAYSRLTAVPNGLEVTLGNAEDADKARTVIRKVNADLVTEVKSGNVVSATYSPQTLKMLGDQVMGQSIEIVGRRVNESGTKEPFIARQGENRIQIQLPGVDNPERIKQLLGKTAKLTFHLVDLDGTVGADSRALPLKDEAGQKIVIKRRAILSGDMLTGAQPSFSDGRPVVSFKLNAEGARKFCDVTTQNVDKPFAIVLDDQVISAPRINEKICGGQAIITGNFSVQEATDTSVLLRAGALPTTLTVVEERSVGPSLGSDSVDSGKNASLVAFALVVVFMIMLYGLFGVFASIALVVNMAAIMSLMAILGATLTLPGIAGIVLTMGMAVDANVLIFERMKEEVRSGKSIIASIDAGYNRAMASIVDSNLTSLISGIILYAVGTGPIKGFAVTMAIGIVTSMFSAIMLTRLMVLIWMKSTKPKELPI